MESLVVSSKSYVEGKMRIPWVYSRTSNSFKVTIENKKKKKTTLTLTFISGEPSCDHPRTSHSQMFSLLSKSITLLHEATKGM